MTLHFFRPCIFLRIASPSLRRLEAPEYGLTIFPRNDTRCARPWMTLKMMSVRLMHAWYKTLFSFSIELPPRSAGACCMLMLVPGSQNVAPWKSDESPRCFALHTTYRAIILGYYDMNMQGRGCANHSKYSFCCNLHYSHAARCLATISRTYNGSR